MRDSEDKIQFITDDIENIPVLEEGEPFMIKGGNKLYIGNGIENIEISSDTDITVNLISPDAANNIQLDHTHVGALPVVNPVAQGMVTSPAFLSSPWRTGDPGDKNGASFFFYDHGGENWAGFGVRSDGMPWIRSGTTNAGATSVWFPAGNAHRESIWVQGVPLSHLFFSTGGGQISGNVHITGWTHINGAVVTDSSISTQGNIITQGELHSAGSATIWGGVRPTDVSVLAPDAWTIHPWVDGVHPNLHYRHPHWGAGTFHTFPLAIRSRPGVSYIGHAHVSINQFQEVIFSIYLNAYVHNGQHITTVPAGFRPVLHQALATGHAFGIGQAATFRINQNGVVQYVGSNYGGEVWAQCAYVGGV